VDDDVDSVQESARELVSVGGKPLRRAGAFGRRIASPAAGTEIHGPDEDEARREDRLPGGACDRDCALLERLTERLERRAVELGELVEEEDSVVREACFSRPRPGSAAHDGRGRCRVMGRPKRRAGHERVAGRKQPCHGVDPGNFQRLLERQPRKDAGQPPREHRLARARRAGQQQIVAACGGELKGPAAPLLAAHVPQIRLAARCPGCIGLDGRRLEPPAQIGARLGEVADGDGLDAGQRGLGGRLRGTDESGEAGAFRRLRRDEGPWHRPKAPVERQLP
jgi:hypothetical protein